MTCPRCGTEADRTARFCAACGQPLSSAGDQRRVVTVVFADIVGFTALSERRDPEAVKNLVDGWFQRLAEVITEFGGQVDKVVGDAIIALFGAPEAHEDDPDRAVRAALRMQKVHSDRVGEVLAPADAPGTSGTGDGTDSAGGSTVRMRIGINTGEVLVGALQAAGTVTAMGDVVNTASRLQTAAEPGEVLVGAATHAATREQIDYESRGRVAARNHAAVEAWAARTVSGPPGSARTRRDLPLVGRERELATLAGAVGSSLDNRRALAVLLVGDAGLGKTRLAEEVGGLAVRSHDALVLEGRCVPYGEANVWWPVAEAIRDGCGIAIDAEPETARAQLAAAVADVGGEAATLIDADTAQAAQAAEVDRTVNGLWNLLGFEHDARVDPANAREEAIRALVTFVRGVLRRRPLVLRLSDLHWADPVLLELIDSVLDRLAREPLVVLATARQAIRDRWHPRPGRHNLVSINLDPLPAEPAGRLLAELLGRAPSPVERSVLLERSGGNPFYLEELVALLQRVEPAAADDAAALKELPDTLRGLVAARLDHLSIDQQAVLTDAAVLGRRGTAQELEHLARGLGRKLDVARALGELVDRDLLEVEGRAWAFRSDVVREVAYGTLTRGDRAARHVGIATWIENHSGDDPDALSDTQVDRLANHWASAVEMGQDLGSGDGPGDARARAVRWCTEAAARARVGEAFPAAEALATRALALVGDEVTQGSVTARLERAEARTEAWQLTGAREDAEVGLNAARSLAEPALVARALRGLADATQKAGDAVAALALLSEAETTSASLGDDGGRGEALRLRGMVELFRGELAAAETAATEARDAFERVSSVRGQAWALQNLAWIAFTTGRTERADELLARSLELFGELGDAVGMAWATGLLSFVRFHQGRNDEAAALAEGVAREADSRQDRWAMTMMEVLKADLDLWRGRTQAALGRAAGAALTFAELGDPFGMMQAAVPHCRALAMVGQVAEARAEHDRLVADLRQRRGDEPALVHLSEAGLLVHAGEPESAQRALDRVGPSDLPELVAVGALAAMQSGDLAGAVSTIGGPETGADGERALQRPFSMSAAALVAAAQGDAGVVMIMAGRVREHRAGTYLDRVTAQCAEALVAVRDGDAGRAHSCLGAARTELEATEDELSRAMVAIAAAVVSSVLGEPVDDSATEPTEPAEPTEPTEPTIHTVGTAEAEVQRRLDSLGIPAAGWWRAFRLAAGVPTGAATGPG